ncbi:39S ribosomal protein L28, mitochondrial-like isoform X3 [Homarus americanus]|uniref:39S ribosomal protein L28-like n=2 Tax=Homarus americanus TaxID=6706 RepID=A0A8J5MRK8_HOMAM|nr:39S ribosomal protein L28, mitochondrial-like isoform X3 [Homarus americanus]KAG7160762.1 39S ribosomal protein L28-like [Homarus americanus]
MASRYSAAAIRESLTKPWNAIRLFQLDSYIGRVPEHYKKFYWEWKCAPKSPVHYVPRKGLFRRYGNGSVQAVQNVPLLLLQPKELHEGIWGGEAIVKGFLKRNPTRRRVPHYWVPTIKTSVVYSEILDRYMNVHVTERALSLIDKHYGLDYYILQTSPADLMSELALKLRREMLLALVRGTLYPNNPAKKQEILDKYKDYIIPEEEADWFGLTTKEAATKQKLIEDRANVPQPLKNSFRAEFIEYLKEKQEEEEQKKIESPSEGSWISRVNPFAKN